jgi:uncharacterized delta-60 repeat protein
MSTRSGKVFALLSLFFLYSSGWVGSGASLTGLLDLSFNPPQFDSTATNMSFLLWDQGILLRKDGRMIIHGAFSEVNGTNINGLARLNVDGSLDSSFNAGTVPTFQVLASALQTDSKILLGGSFTNFNGVPTSRLVRLNDDGSVDAAFNVGGPPFSGVWTLVLQPDGKIVIGGDFTSVNGVPVIGVARLMNDGVLDTNFNASIADIGVHSMALQPDGKILVATLEGVHRLNPDGSFDQAFETASRPPASLAKVLVQGGGKILVAAMDQFSINGKSSIIMRLLPDGSLDASFAPFAFGRNANMVLDLQERILLFSIPIGDGISLVRLSTNGIPDASFDLITGLDYPMVGGAAVQPDGQLLIAGNFNRIDGVPRTAIARLNPTNSTSVIFLGTQYAYVHETDTNAQVQIVRHGNLANPATVEYGTQDGTAKDGVQFVGEAGILTFAPGETSKQITIPLIADQLPGPLYSDFTITLTNTGGDAVLNETYAIETVSIEDEDVLVELEATNYVVNEFGPAAIVTVKRTAPYTFPGDILLDYSTSDLTAQAGKDYQAVSGTLRFLGFHLDWPGPDELQIAVPIVDNTVVDGNRSFKLMLSNARFANSVRGTVTLGTNRAAEITIIDNDTAAGPGQGTDGAVLAAARQTDGKILIQGQFNQVNGMLRHKLARLNPDLTLDTNFDAGTAWDFEPVTSLPVSNGKVMLGGLFSQVNGVSRQCIARLNSDGSVDSSFVAPALIRMAYNPAQILSILDQTNGQYLVAGAFSGFTGAPSRPGLARLNANGSFDGAFQPNYFGSIASIFTGSCLFRTADGKIVLLGNALVGDSWETFAVRLLPDGSVDPTFHGAPPISMYDATGVSVPDGNVVLISYNNAVMLNSDGSLNSGFGSPLSFRAFSVAAQSDGKVLFAGAGVLARLGEDGITDPSFRPGINGYVFAVVTLADDRIFIGGDFTAIDGVPRYRFAVLEPNGDPSGAVRLTSSRDANGGIHLSSSPPVPDGFVVQASTNLTDWFPIFTNTPYSSLDFSDVGRELERRFYRVVRGP